MTAFLRPTSLTEALAARRSRPTYTVIAGGTDLMVRAEERPEPEGLIDLFRLRELTGIEERGAGLWIGPSTTYSELLADNAVCERLPMLAAAAREVGAVQIQNRGTLGGNVGTSSPVGDTLPVLLALDATIEVASADAARSIPYSSFCTGYRKTALAHDELITGILIPLPGSDVVQRFRKVGTRRAQAISKAVVAAAYAMADGKISWMRLAVGAMADRPVRIQEVESLVTGQTPSGALADEAATLTRKTLAPIDDVRSTARYRIAVVANLIASMIRQI